MWNWYAYQWERSQSWRRMEEDRRKKQEREWKEREFERNERERMRTERERERTEREEREEREWELEREQREWKRERVQEREREAKRLRRRLRKQLALLKDVITRDILLTKNLHSLCEYLRFYLRDRSHSWLLVLAVLLFALFLELLSWFILVGLFTTFCEYIHPLFKSNAFDGNSWSPLSDLLITRHSPYLEEFEGRGWCRHVEAQYWDLRVPVINFSHPTHCSGSFLSDRLNEEHFVWTGLKKRYRYLSCLFPTSPIVTGVPCMKAAPNLWLYSLLRSPSNM